MGRVAILTQLALVLLAVVPGAVFARTLMRDGTLSAWSLLLGLLALGAAVGLLLPRRHRTFYLVNVMAAYVALYAVEVYVALKIRPLEGAVHISMQHWWRSATAKLGDPGKQDRRSKITVLDDFRRNGVDAVPVVPGSLFLAKPLEVGGRAIMPLGGISRRMTVNCNEYGVWSTYHADELGFSNPPGLWAKKVDVAVLGDSFTYGACVPEGRNLVDHIRTQIPATVNVGLGGSGPLFVLARLAEFVASKRPAKVVYVYYEGNDLQDLANESRNAILMHYLEDGFSQKLAAQVPEVDEALLAYYRNRAAAGADADVMAGLILTNPPVPKDAPVSSEIRISDVLRMRNLRALFGNSGSACRPVGPYSDANLALLRRVLARAKADVAGWGGQFTLAYLPEWQSYLEPSYSACFKRRDRVLGMAKELGIPVINLADRIGADELDRYWFSPQTHFGEEGYARAGAMIARELKK
jgi:hypothetical protein